MLNMSSRAVAIDATRTYNFPTKGLQLSERGPNFRTARSVMTTWVFPHLLLEADVKKIIRDFTPAHD